ncbi:MAG: hypothetical protein V1708_02380 [Candidatus Micrarchaeota archaeon]
MKRAFLALALVALSSLALSGCTLPQWPGSPTTVPSPNATATPTATADAAEIVLPTAVPQCEPASARIANASIPQPMTMSKTYDISVRIEFSNGTCKGKPPKTLAVIFQDGRRALASVEVDPAKPQQDTSFEWLAQDDSRREILVSLPAPYQATKAKIILQAQPFGFFPQGGGVLAKVDYEHRYAMAFDVESGVRAASIELFARRLKEMPNGDFTIQIRADNGGKPSGSNEYETRRGILLIPKNAGAVRFGLPPGTILHEGRHWLVVYSVSPDSFEAQTFNLNAAANSSLRAVISTLEPGVEKWMPWDSGIYFKVSGLPA